MAATTTSQDPTWREWTALLLLAFPLFMMATDFTSMFLAMPEVAAALDPGTTQLLWIVHVGEFVAAGAVITMGWLTGRIGPRALLLVAMAVYAVSSALAAFAPTPETLIVARVLVGIGTAAAAPAGFAMLRGLFPSARHFGIGVAVVMGAFSVGRALGPPLAGFLLEEFWWGSVFLVNVPVALLTLLGGLWLFPRPDEKTTDRIDLTSVVISLAAVTLAVYGLQEIADRGVELTYGLSVLAGLVLGYWFVRRQKRLDNPLLDLNLFSVRVLRLMAVVFLLSQAAFVAVDFILIQYLQIVLAVPAGRLGLILAIPAVAAIAATALTPALARRFSPAPVMVAGTLICTAGALLVVAVIQLAPGITVFTAAMTLMSFGLSLPMVLGAQLMITSVPKKDSGPAASVQDISASLGSALGMVALGSLAMTVFGRLVTAGAPEGIPADRAEAAANSPGGAVAVTEQIGGAAGQEMLTVVRDAWSWGTLAAAVLAAVIGVVMVLLLLGLRGVQMPDDEPDDPEEPDGSAGPDNSEPFGEPAPEQPLPRPEPAAWGPEQALQQTSYEHQDARALPKRRPASQPAPGERKPFEPLTPTERSPSAPPSEDRGPVRRYVYERPPAERPRGRHASDGDPATRQSPVPPADPAPNGSDTDRQNPDERPASQRPRGRHASDEEVTQEFPVQPGQGRSDTDRQAPYELPPVRLGEDERDRTQRPTVRWGRIGRTPYVWPVVQRPPAERGAAHRPSPQWGPADRASYGRQPAQWGPDRRHPGRDEDDPGSGVR